MLFLGIFIIFCHITTLEKTCLKEKIVLRKKIIIIIIIIIIMNVIKKCHFSRSLFGNFSCVDDHWEVIVALKSTAP